MAFKFIFVVALFALCHSSPVFINGVLYRDGRSFAVGQGYSSNYGGNNVATGTASVRGDNAQAYGSGSTDGHFARFGGLDPVYPGQAGARAEVYKAPEIPEYGSAKAVAQAQNGGAYYPVAVPETVITYQQNFQDPSEIVYAVPVSGSQYAKSSAVLSGASDTITSSASSIGAGSALSSAQTQRGVGNYGSTATNAKSVGSGFGSAAANANTGYVPSVTIARTQGLNAVYGTASSKAQAGLGSPVSSADAQTNGDYGLVSAIDNNDAYEATIAAAKTQGIGSGYGSAISSANVNGEYDGTVSLAKANNRKRIHWHFGTAYGTPSDINTRIVSYVPARASDISNANANANVNNAEYGYAKSSANTNSLGYGSVQSSVNTNSGFGSAKSSANTSGSLYGARTDANANTSGFGTASSKANAQGVNTGYRTANSAANTSGFGSTQANVHRSLTNFRQ